jgi:orotidine-5'-phosphate decarboxylase
MNRKELISGIKENRTFLCAGLDTDIQKIPKYLLSMPDPVFEFNRQIIDATKAHCIAYKINTAFYESRGIKGWESLEKTLDYIPEGIFTIADAKRGDIGNTANHYARTFFETFPFDAVTLSPYMGEDSIRPFLEFEGKWAIILGLTSNPGAFDFQFIETGSGNKLYEEVITKCASWGSPDNMMFVTGATRAEMLKDIRSIIPDHFLLVPGIGAQGGSLDNTFDSGANKDIGLLINSSRDIIFADHTENFGEAARIKAALMHEQMAALMAGMAIAD